MTCQKCSRELNIVPVIDPFDRVGYAAQCECGWATRPQCLPRVAERLAEIPTVLTPQQRALRALARQGTSDVWVMEDA